MKQEERELLLKDLCARLPYGVKLDIDNRIGTLFELDIDLGFGCYRQDGAVCFYSNIEDAKPYLRPMSSMTKEKYYEFRLLPLLNYESYDWLLQNHFDFRGLIEKGLALEAPEGMYKFE